MAEILETYDDIDFAKTWRDMHSTQEEIDQAVVEYEYIQEDGEVRTYLLDEYIDLQYELFGDQGVPDFIIPYVDVVSWLFGQTQGGEIDILKTKSGYFVVDTSY